MSLQSSPLTARPEHMLSYDSLDKGRCLTNSVSYKKICAVYVDDTRVYDAQLVRWHTVFIANLIAGVICFYGVVSGASCCIYAYIGLGSPA